MPYIDSYEAVIYEFDKFLKSEKCNSIDIIKSKFNELLSYYYDVEEQKEIDALLESESEEYFASSTEPEFDY